MRFKQNRAAGFAIITAVYVIATGLAAFVFMMLANQHIFLRVFWADIAATLLVYLAGLVLGNASMYDPYWSVAPIVVAAGLCLYYRQLSPGVLLLLAVIGYWGVRLTANWAVTFQGLDKQDWRYDHFKRLFPQLYPLISLGGIHLVPTLVVYLALLPVIVFIQYGGTLNAITLLGAVICIGAVSLQLVADTQMHRFIGNPANHNALIRTGVWKHARHPNYLGEILMWWGVYVIMLSALPNQWHLGIGALANTLLFLCISIPLADRHNAQKRTGFETYKQQTRSLLPLPRPGTN